MCDGAEYAFRKRSQQYTTNDKSPSHSLTEDSYRNIGLGPAIWCQLLRSGRVTRRPLRWSALTY
jgi:hypothetical protein